MGPLLAESITFDAKVLVSVLTAVFAVGGTIAVLKFRASYNEKETSSAKGKIEKESEKRESRDEKLNEKLDGIAKALGDNTDMLKSRMVRGEKESREMIQTFQSKTFSRLDKIQEKLADHDKRLTVAETERQHMRTQVEETRRKVTRGPTS